MKGVKTETLQIIVTLSFFFVFGSDASSNKNEQEVLQKFRFLVEQYIEEDFMRGDFYLLKWIRYNDYDLQKAFDGFVKHIQWRKELNLANPDQLELQIPEMKVLMPMRLTGRTKDGRPIIECFVGDWNLRKLALAGRNKDIVRWFFRNLELGAREARRIQSTTNPNVTSFYVLVDMSRLSQRAQLCVACLPNYLSFIQGYEANFPLAMSSLNFVNNPRIFDPVVTLMRPFMSQTFRDMIKLYGYDKIKFERKIFSDIERNQVSPVFGGTWQDNHI